MRSSDHTLSAQAPLEHRHKWFRTRDDSFQCEWCRGPVVTYLEYVHAAPEKQFQKFWETRETEHGRTPRLSDAGVQAVCDYVWEIKQKTKGCKNFVLSTGRQMGKRAGLAALKPVPPSIRLRIPLIRKNRLKCRCGNELPIDPSWDAVRCIPCKGTITKDRDTGLWVMEIPQPPPAPPAVGSPDYLDALHYAKNPALAIVPAPAPNLGEFTDIMQCICGKKRRFRPGIRGQSYRCSCGMTIALP